MLPLGWGGCSSCEMLPLVGGLEGGSCEKLPLVGGGGGGPVRSCPWWEGTSYEMLPLVGGWGRSWGVLGRGVGCPLCSLAAGCTEGSAFLPEASGSR